ncbi:MAG: type II secretion system protein [Armatimonadota bacterium]|nr:type II secretion system GspH family protein [Armatimonadota bacterium]MDW8143656.1 type II secretion system protein [Armatimonadota bacterium]
MRCLLPFTPCPLRKKGLTLVELLVVIGIVVILCAIVYIVFPFILEKALITHCVNNFKQLHLTIEMYREDYNGIDPVGRHKFWELGLPLNPRALKPYAKTSSLYCPLVYFPEKMREPWMVGYMWAVWDGRALGNSGPDWSEVIAKRKEEFPISADCNHNPRGDKEFPSKFVILLRLNGNIETKRIWVLGVGSHEW